MSHQSDLLDLHSSYFVYTYHKLLTIRVNKDVYRPLLLIEKLVFFLSDHLSLVFTNQFPSRFITTKNMGKLIFDPVLGTNLNASTNSQTHQC